MNAGAGRPRRTPRSPAQLRNGSFASRASDRSFALPSFTARPVSELFQLHHGHRQPVDQQSDLARAGDAPGGLRLPRGANIVEFVDHADGFGIGGEVRDVVGGGLALGAIGRQLGGRRCRPIPARRRGSRGTGRVRRAGPCSRCSDAAPGVGWRVGRGPRGSADRTRPDRSASCTWR